MADDVTPTDDPSVTPPEEPTVPVESSEPEVPKEAPEGGDPAPEGDPKPEDSEKADAGESAPLSVDIEVDGNELSVDVSPEIDSVLEQCGLKSSDVVKELYEGEFGLSDATLDKLSKTYPKPLVEAYISGIKAQNEVAAKSLTEAQAKIEAADEARWQETLEIVGSEENWSALESWAADNWEDSQFEDFNRVMQSGDSYAQKLAVQHVMEQYRQAEGDNKLDLITGDSSKGDDVQGAISAKQYEAAFTSGEYEKDPAGWDARRRKGIKQGI